MKFLKILRLPIPFLPFMYVYVTRLGTVFRFFQFFGGEILPITVMTYLLANNASILAIFDVKFATFMLFSLFVYVTFFTLYEIGYIINDCVASEYEAVPSIRYIDRSKWKFLVLSKSIFFALFTVLASIIFRIEICAFLAYCIVTIFLFVVHNRLAIQDRGGSYFWLQFMRLMVLPYVNFQNSDMWLVVAVFIFPEIVRRSVRYMRIKYLSYDRRFSTFDLQTSLLSVFIVGFLLLAIDASLIFVLATGYSIIVAGILISMYLGA